MARSPGDIEMGNGHPLEKSLTLGPAIGLAITMVVGSGLLVLPGLAYSQVGDVAVYAWLISAIAVGPILIIYSVLGARFPNAGGIAGFMQATYGKASGIASEFLIFGAIPGGAAIAITGGQYFAALTGGSQITVIIGTGVVLFMGGLVNFLGARLSGKIQQILALVLVLLLTLVALTAFAFGGHIGKIAPLRDWPQSIPAFGLVFFAFVGWEMMAFTSEEFINPRRDFPLMMVASFGIVLVLYALIAVSTQWVFQPNDPILVHTPIVGILSKVLGAFSGRFVAGIGFVLVLANFSSVVWAFSRLVISSAREGLLPQTLAQLDKKRNAPTRAVTAVTIGFGLFALAYFAKLMSHNLLFELASISFFFSYLLAVLVYLKLANRALKTILGIVALVLAIGLQFSFGLKGLYAIALFLIGLFLGKIRLARTSIFDKSVKNKV
jgi:amino acid efflux transporter